MSAPALAPIRVAANGHYFETTDKEPFLFIGANDAITWPGLAGLYRRRDLAGVEAYLDEMVSSGINIVRLMLEYSHVDGRYFERPAGRFNPAMIHLWDDLFAICERLGLRVLLAPWDNFWMARRWHRHPYNALNGGPAANPQAFFTDETTIEFTIKRFQFVVQRWGGSGVLAAWDLFNEIHPHWGGTPAQQSAVISRISQAVRQEEEKCWGFSRPQTVSIFGPQPSEEYEDLIFRHPDLDFATTHIYQGAIDYPRDTIKPAETMARWVHHALERVPAGRPFLDTEHGPIHLFNDHGEFLPEEFDNEYERHLSWAHLASGGAGSGMRWPARHPHVLTNGMRKSLDSMSEFIKYFSWRDFTPRPAVDDVKVSKRGVRVFACRDEKRALIWLLRGGKRGQNGTLPKRESLSDVKLNLCGLHDGEYSICCWNTRAGCCEQVLNTSSKNGVLLVRLPTLENDLALAVQPMALAQEPFR